MEEKNKGGRPRKYNTLEEFKQKADEYFDYCDSMTIRDDNNKLVSYKPYTISGLCIYLDITRETLCNYEDNHEFFDTIKKTKHKIENYVEEMSLSGMLNPTVSIFNLKNNYNWKDKIETENENKNTNVNMTLEEYLSKVSDKDEY